MPESKKRVKKKRPTKNARARAVHRSNKRIRDLQNTIREFDAWSPDQTEAAEGDHGS